MQLTSLGLIRTLPTIILGIRIRSEGLAQVMTKRNVNHRKYTEIPTRDTVVAGLS